MVKNGPGEQGDQTQPAFTGRELNKCRLFLAVNMVYSLAKYFLKDN